MQAARPKQELGPGTMKPPSQYVEPKNFADENFQHDWTLSPNDVGASVTANPPTRHKKGNPTTRDPFIYRKNKPGRKIRLRCGFEVFDQVPDRTSTTLNLSRLFSDDKCLIKTKPTNEVPSALLSKTWSVEHTVVWKKQVSENVTVFGDAQRWE